ncbi:MAG: hypothetical protein M1817_006237 [Caeruleum heppii]|nr:MAG: hypothetical protein M1817_006237 [Caeruleum heppii]
MPSVRYISEPAGLEQELLHVSPDLGVGRLQNGDVLKFPLTPDDPVGAAALDHEAAIFETLGPHRHIVRLVGRDERGLRLEYASNGDLAKRIERDASDEQHSKWCRQTAEAVVHMHHHDVLHCDLKLSNILLDHDLNVKVCDFQGQYRSKAGLLVQSLVAGQAKFCLRPRDDPVEQTDIFALGSCIYHIMEGHKPFADLDDWDDEAIEARFRNREFHFLHSVRCGDIIRRCWEGTYGSAREVLVDLEDPCLQ